jgi:hypothetical protein
MNSQMIAQEKFERAISREVAQRQNDERMIREQIADKGRDARRARLLEMALWEKEPGHEMYIGGMYNGVQDTYGLQMYFYRYGWEIERDNKYRRNARAAVRRAIRKQVHGRFIMSIIDNLHKLSYNSHINRERTNEDKKQP